MGLCAKKSRGHVEGLADLCGLFNGENVVDKIYQAEDVEEIIDILSE